MQRESLSAQLDLTVTKAESEQLARALQEEQYFELSQENKKSATRHKQDVGEKEATIARVSKPPMYLQHKFFFLHSETLFFIISTLSTKVIVNSISLQLEESNKTLTKDVENLSKEKSELNEKLLTQEEGTFPFDYLHVSYPSVICFFVQTKLLFPFRVCSSEGRDCKLNQGQL